VQIPDSIIKAGITLEDQFFDLKGLSVYSSLGISSLRYHIRENALPCYSIRNDKGQVTKTLIKRSEFDRWMQKRWRDDLNNIVDDVMKEFYEWMIVSSAPTMPGDWLLKVSYHGGGFTPTRFMPMIGHHGDSESAALSVAGEKQQWDETMILFKPRFILDGVQVENPLAIPGNIPDSTTKVPERCFEPIEDSCRRQEERPDVTE
jgi:hypothetical protein